METIEFLEKFVHQALWEDVGYSSQLEYPKDLMVPGEKGFILQEEFYTATRGSKLYSSFFAWEYQSDTLKETALISLGPGNSVENAVETLILTHIVL
jgi:hypothetical protein